MHEINKTIAAVRRVIDAGRRGILVTVVRTSGSTYRRPGARVVISEDGESFGMLSGGCVERDLAERIAPWLHGGPRMMTYDSNATSDAVFGLGLGCRGVIEMLIEPFDAANLPQLVTAFRWNGRKTVSYTTQFEGREILTEEIRPERALAIFGGGPDVVPLARLAEQVGWRASVIAPREVHPEEVSQKIDLDSFDAAIIMTHNFLHDAALLSALLPCRIEYVGLLGPKSRGEELLAQLPELSAAARAKLHSPIGLDLAAETPEEIALSILAEVQKVLSGASGRPLSEIDGPIHRTAGVPA